MNFKKYTKYLILIILITSMLLVLIFNIVGNSINTNDLDEIIGFKDFDISLKNEFYLEKLIKQHSKLVEKYTNKINEAISNKWIEIETEINVDHKINDVDFEKNNSNVKSGLDDKVYLNQYSMGYYYPRASNLGELERYEVANYSRLEELGYSLYVGSDDINFFSKDNKNEKAQLKVSNIDMNDEISFDVDPSKYGAEHFYKVNNIDKTNCIYFQSQIPIPTQKEEYEKFVNSKFESVIPLKIIAAKNNEINEDKDILESDWPGFNVTINNANNNDFIQARLGDWIKFSYTKSNDIQNFIAVSSLGLYCEMAENYLSFLSDKKHQPIWLLNGFSGLTKYDPTQDDPQGFDGVSSASLLYFMIKYKAYFNYYFMTLSNGVRFQLFLDQNMPLNQEIKVEKPSEFKKIVYKNENRMELEFNPIIMINDEVYSFITMLWNKTLQYQSKTIPEWDN